MLRHVVLAVAIIVCIAPARAQTGDPAIDKLHLLFADMMKLQQSRAMQSGAQLTYDGPATIEKADNYYAATLPGSTLKLANGNTVHIAMIPVNTTPTEKPDEWSMAIALPTAFIIKNPQGDTIQTLSIGRQKATGIWNDTIDNFVTLNATYEDVVMKNDVLGSTFSAPKIELSLNLEEKENGKLSGPLTAGIENLSFLSPQEKTKINIGRLSAALELFNYDKTLLAQNKNLPFLQMLTRSGDGIRSQYKINLLEIIRPQEGYDSLTRTAVNRVTFNLNTANFLADSITMETSLDMDDLDYQPLSEDATNVLPQEIHYHLKFEKLPAQSLIETIQTLAQSATGQTAWAQMTGLSMLTKIPALLAQSGTTLMVDNNFLRNDIYEVRLNGTAAADLKAVNNLTTDMLLEIYDMDFMINALKTAATQRRGPYNFQMQQLADFLVLSKNFSVKETNDKGRTIHKYRFEVKTDGQILVNGQSLSAVMGQTLFGGLTATGGGQQ